MRIRVSKAVTIDYDEDDLEFIDAVLSGDESAVDAALSGANTHHVTRWAFKHIGLYGPKHTGHYFSQRKVDGNNE